MTDTTSHPPTVPAVRPPSSEQFINDLADLMAHSTRTPILRRPNEYGIDFEEVFFPAVDGVTLECSSKALSTGRVSRTASHGSTRRAWHIIRGGPLGRRRDRNADYGSADRSGGAIRQLVAQSRLQNDATPKALGRNQERRGGVAGSRDPGDHERARDRCGRVVGSRDRRRLCANPSACSHPDAARHRARLGRWSALASGIPCRGVALSGVRDARGDESSVAGGPVDGGGMHVRTRR